MKKIVIFLCFFIIGFINCFSQDIVYDYALLIGNRIPPDFTRINRTHYQKITNEYAIIVTVYNNIITSSNIGAALNTTHDAHSWFSKMYDLLEKNGWLIVRSERNGSETFKKGKYSAYLSAPEKREDNLIAVGVYIEEVIIDFSNYKFELISWINKISELIGKNHLFKDDNNLIFSYNMEKNSKCSIYGIDNNSNKLMIIIQNDNYEGDIEILFDQILDELKKRRISHIGEIEEGVEAFKIGNFTIITNTPGNIYDRNRKKHIVTIFLSRG